MANTYYCDIGSPAAWNDRAGRSTSGEYLGVTGLQNLLDTMSQGDLAYIKGTGDFDKTYSVAYTSPSGSIVNGEGVSWHDGSGVVQFKGALASPVLIEITSGNPPTSGDVITGTSTNTITTSGTPARVGLDVDTNAGDDVNGLIKVIGVNASWVKDGTKAVLDGGGTLADELLYTNKAYWWWENLRVTNNAGSNQNGIEIGYVYANTFVNVEADSVTGAGFYDGGQTNYYRCTAHDNNNGFYTTYSSVRMFFCSAHDNTGYGIMVNGSMLIFASLFYRNGSTGGLYINGGAVFLNCVFDENTQKGIEMLNLSVQGALFIGCRVTNHSGAGDIGIDGASDTFMTFMNYLENNQGDNIQNATKHYFVPLDGGTTTTNSEDQGDTDQGYTDRTDGSEDYTLRSDATYRREGITIPLS